MGSSVNSFCKNCKYEKSLMIGGGMSNHTTYAAWPIACSSCRSVTTANFKSLPLKCLRCNSEDVETFNTSKNWQGDGSEVISWGNGKERLTLTNGHYRCPSCGALELSFRAGSLMWD